MDDGVRCSPSSGGWKAGLASAEFRLASPQMPRVEARGASLKGCTVVYLGDAKNNVMHSVVFDQTENRLYVQKAKAAHS